MEVVKNDNKNKNEKNPLTLAEMEACQQFEASDRAGQALFHPRVVAAEVREELKRKLDLKFNTIEVGWFPDIEPDEDILDAAAGGSAHPLFGRGDLVQRLVKLPDDKELQPQLNDGYIKKEVTALSRASTVG